MKINKLFKGIKHSNINTDEEYTPGEKIIHDKYGEVVIITVENTIQELSSLEYLIGMRFHANLVAAKAGVKVLGINYDIKVLNLAKYVGFPIIGLDENKFEQEFEKLINLDSSNYKIPVFEFPEI